MTHTVLCIDDEPSIRHAITRVLSDHQVLAAEDLAQGLQQMQDGYPDLVLIDQCLPDGQGIDVVPQLRRIDPDVPIILMTGHGSTELAVDALKIGISDYIEKPFKIDRLRLTVGNLLRQQELGRQVKRLSGSGRSRSHMIADSKEMKRVMAMIKRVAGVPATTVLIQGESGVGKELVARSIHERSSRAKEAFVAINCAALSEHLLEAELFGYEKGAFTGADSKGKAGLFEAADGGTIFLDEVGEMPLTLQTKLLRVLQERRFRKVGGITDIEVDVRVVAATNRDLRQEVLAGTFRQDLYFRLRVVPVQVPPLRERPHDIIPLAQHLRQRLAPELGRPELEFAPEALTAMRDYDWPGNVRELANAVERGVIIAQGEAITVEDLIMDEVLNQTEVVDEASGEVAVPNGALVIPLEERNLANIERLVIQAALSEAGGRKSRAADMLGINRTTLYHKLRDFSEAIV